MKKIRPKLKKKRHRTCRACNRPLTSIRSQQVGMGPGCRKRYSGLMYHEMLEEQGQLRLFD